MALPTSDTQAGLDTGYKGQPYAEIVTKNTINTFDLDVGYKGQPFTANPAPSGGGGGSTGQIKVYLGGTWVAKPVKVYNGATWVTKPVKYYNGATWTTTPY